MGKRTTPNRINNKYEIELRGAHLVVIEATHEFKKCVKSHGIHSYEEMAESDIDNMQAYTELTEAFIEEAAEALEYLKTSFLHFTQLQLQLKKIIK
jgi:hypothetical protein